MVEQYYPSLSEATISVDEAKMLNSAIGNILMEVVLDKMKDIKIIEVKQKLIDVLCKDGERVSEITRLLSTLEDETLYVAREIIEGTTRSIDQMVMDEMKERKLDSLQTNWDKYLN